MIERFETLLKQRIGLWVFVWKKGTEPGEYSIGGFHRNLLRHNTLQ